MLIFSQQKYESMLTLVALRTDARLVSNLQQDRSDYLQQSRHRSNL